MANAISLISNDLLNLFIGRYYNANKSSFAGTEAIPDLDVEFVYTVNAVPVFSLTENIHLKEPVTDNTPSFSVTMHDVVVNLYEYENGQRGKLLDSSTFTIIISGIFVLSSNGMTVVSLNGTVEGESNVRLTNYVVNNKIVPELQNRISSIKFPQTIAVMDQDITLNPLSLTKEAGHLRLDISVDGGGGDTSLQPGSGSVFGVALNQDAVQRIVNAIGMFPIGKSGSKESESHGYGYKVDYTASSNVPTISISGSSATAYVNINTRVHLHVYIALWPDYDHSFDLPTARANIGLHLNQHGESASVSLSMDRLDFSLPHLDLPWPISELVDVILDWISGAVRSAIESAIVSALSNIHPPLFSLPDSFPGTSIPANLSFQSLGFADSAARGVTNVS